MELEFDILRLEEELSQTQFELEQKTVEFQALEHKVQMYLGCRYSGDAGERCKKAARQLLCYDEAKKNLAAVNKTLRRALVLVLVLVLVVLVLVLL